MQIYNLSEFKPEDDQFTLQDRFQAIMKYGFSWPNEMNAQEVFASNLEKEIDQRSILIRNFKLPEVGVTIPLILIGPPGVQVILLTRDRGMFRAKDQQWLIHSGRGFRPAPSAMGEEFCSPCSSLQPAASSPFSWPAAPRFSTFPVSSCGCPFLPGTGKIISSREHASPTR